MNTRSNKRCGRRSPVSRADEGVTFIEMLVAVVLLGTVVLAVVTALRTTIIATRIERDHAKAGQWLESATRRVEATAFGDCSTADGVPASAENARAIYVAAVDGAAVPEGWSPDQIVVDANIQVWDGEDWQEYAEADACFDNLNLNLQLITIEVRSPDGSIIESIEVVKRG